MKIINLILSVFLFLNVVSGEDKHVCTVKKTSPVKISSDAVGLEKSDVKISFIADWQNVKITVKSSKSLELLSDNSASVSGLNYKVNTDVDLKILYKAPLGESRLYVYVQGEVNGILKYGAKSFIVNKSKSSKKKENSVEDSNGNRIFLMKSK